MTEGGETTVLTPATTQSKSLRTTVPVGIVRHFALGNGDKLQWKIEARGNELVIVARPLKKAQKKVAGSRNSKDSTRDSNE